MNKATNVNGYGLGLLGLADWILTLVLTVAVAAAIVSGAGAISGL
jgi:hypothetical protein